ncbi:hypothetical protein, partial [Propionibacterium freudenreichii]|uniref:hypothetical protein n=1 Tax=Propionibacterium freudenreichii TaxID=1744 RepID=UPI0038550BD5
QNIKVFSAGGRLQFGNIESLRSAKPTCIVIDEASFNITNQLNVFNCKIFAVSTLNYTDGWFSEICKSNEFLVYHPSYKEHPNHTEEWE